MKPKLKRIPQTGLRWNNRYADPGDGIEVWPLILERGRPKSFYAIVQKVCVNRYGRVSYKILKNPHAPKRDTIFTEELTPLGHRGCCR